MEIRRFEAADRPELRELFGRAGEGSPVAALWGDPESEASIYLDPYLDLTPESVFVAVADGKLVGYLTGCPDSSRFPAEAERIERAIRAHRLWVRPATARFFGVALVDTLVAAIRRRPTAGDFQDVRWPAHLHIAVAAEARGTGAAAALLDVWLARLDEGGLGCHLQTQVENTRAVAFFTRRGFVPFGSAPVIPGMRYAGERVHQLTMVRPGERA
ncbi:GNAT family N-acetyltransferase [Nocardia beijingensis]|uniref:GNAT family N-acetyltransferase n=1 Tax=Nocardia beijingensis TaxID=95162 RepID=UPI001894020C|nr:GNAT family N-acetyltransferase [Nocardia beijingensis]MBF6468522.1 GNAT family N-acetyltransferase [Nocardia beijingensis]